MIAKVIRLSVVMPDRTPPGLSLAQAPIMTPGGVIAGALDIRNGLISAVRPGATPKGSTNLAEDLVIPGIVDLPSDPVETHAFPAQACSGTILRR